MAKMCPHSGDHKCSGCHHYGWDESNERMACFLGKEMNREDGERFLLRSAYALCRNLLDMALPEDEMDDAEVTEVYEAAERFCKAVEDLGYAG